MVFVNSMSDLFQEEVPDEYIVSVVRVMQLANWHTYQVLTKRSERMRDMLETKLKFASVFSHIWWGVSVENKRHGLQRIKHLQASPATIRFLSIEPLLEDVGRFSLTGIDWVIVGGESGAGARAMKRSLGCFQSSISAEALRYLFSLSNGVAFERVKPAGPSTARI